MKNVIAIALFFSLQFVSNNIHSQVIQFKGTWIKINTTYVFEFDLLLRHKGKEVEGYFVWKVAQLDENSTFSKKHYADKIGLTGKEYVRGTYDPTSGIYRFKGYKKEDPHQIIGIDTYELQLDSSGEIGGDTSSGGTWLGRINGKQVTTPVM